MPVCVCSNQEERRRDKTPTSTVNIQSVTDGHVNIGLHRLIFVDSGVKVAGPTIAVVTRACYHS